MSNQIQHSTICYNLFHKTAEEVYTISKYSEDFVEKSLQTLLRISHYLIDKKNALFLLDPVASNKQCHLYSLMVAQNHPDERFKYLAFMLGFAFMTDAKLLSALVKKAAEETHENLPTPKNKFEKFLQDGEGERTRAARCALIDLFEKHLKTTLEAKREISLLDKELYQLTQESLHGPEGYVYPKFAGLVLLVDTLVRENIVFLFKVKVMTEKGSGRFSYCRQEPPSIKEGTPVFVFEMIATDLSRTYLECRDVAKACPHHSRRHPSQKNRHEETTTCLFCVNDPIDITPYQKRYLPILESTEKVLYALGADYTKEIEPSMEAFFHDQDRYPKLTSLFQNAITSVEVLGLSATTPFNMSVSHTYTDCAPMAFSETLLIEDHYRNHLTKRGLI